MPRYSISQPVRQLEAPRLLKGQGRYTDDVVLSSQAFAIFLRSPYAHAVIKSIDADYARQMPGVLGVLTGEDYVADGLGPVRGISPFQRRDGSPMYRPDRPALAQGKVRHVGHMVAMVVAETIHQAKDAAEAIVVDYEPLPVNVSTAKANSGEVEDIYEDCTQNEPVYREHGDSDAVDAAIAKAAHVVTGIFPVNRVAANSMEPRAVNASYDSGRDHYTVYACLQRPYVWRTMMCKHIFKMPESRMTIIAGDVGGSFGMKGGLYPEIPLAVWASKRFGRPVKWTCERSEGHLADDQARDMHVEGTLALDENGKFLGIRLVSNNNVGAFITMIGFLSTNGIASAVSGPYMTPAVHGVGRAVLTNTVPVSNYRAPGGAPSAYVIERLVDIAAAEMGIDPAELRRRNLIPAEKMPYKSPTGETYDCGEFGKVLEKCIHFSDYAGAKQRQSAARSAGLLYGIGVSTAVDPSAGPSPETAELRFDPGGDLTILCGTTAGGQSHETIYTQIVSEKLGVDSDRITVVEGDTSRLSWGTGTGAARSATIGGTVVFKAAEKVIEKAKKIAAHLLEAAADDIEFENGIFRIAGTDREVSMASVVETAFTPNKLPADIEIGLYETATWSPDVANVPNAANICEVQIDPDTGVTEIKRYYSVHDVGVELNPLLVDGQMHGSIAQAAGQALMENMAYDQQTGQILSGSFMDYAMPRADNFCDFSLDRHPVPTPTNPLGVKGAGETATVAGLPAVMNAVNDALLPLGIRDISMPATPEKLWKAINSVA
ncbi:MAG: xanthine dehydrogenase family protein molybdopterin-binding subunit [Rhodospirillaceae bacterium]